VPLTVNVIHRPHIPSHGTALNDLLGHLVGEGAVTECRVEFEVYAGGYVYALR
jgi:hypothetical protein